MPHDFHKRAIALAGAALVAIAPLGLFAKDELAALDDQIVQAYNANPKKTAEVYSLCLDMIDLASGKKGEKAAAWVEKAKKLMTLACLNEAIAAQKLGDFKQVYIWCGRGVSQGASQGEIGGLNLAEVSALLSNLQANAKTAMDATGESYSNLSLQFRPPSRSDARTLHSGERSTSASSAGEGGVASSIAAAEAIDVKDAGLEQGSSLLQGKLRSGSKKGIAILEGPRLDKERTLFVRIQTPSGKDVKIVFVKDKGWTDSALPSPIYYETWTNCAEEILRNDVK